METKTYTVYKFNELQDDQKEKAIENLRDINVEYEWYDYSFDDYKAIAKILGINIDKIYFSGFCSQGDGLCFEGSFQYAKGWKRELTTYAGEVTENKNNKEIHALGQQLQELQRQAFYGVYGTVKQRGHYQHSGCTSFSLDHDEYREFDDEDFKQAYRELMDTFYHMLRKEYEYLTCDEAVIETIKCNDYNFDENGKIA